MTVHIDFDAKTEAELRAKSAAVGVDLATFIRDAVEDKLAAVRIESAILSPAQRAAEWLKWTESHPRLGIVADDSRESIYAGRGE